MVNVLINLKDIEYSSQLKDFIEEKQKYSVWNVINKETLVNIIEKDIIKEDDIRVVITDAKNKDIINNLSVNGSYYFIYITDTLSFECKNENSACIFKTINFDNFLISINMFERIHQITNNKTIINYRLNDAYDTLKNKLNKELIQSYDIASQLLQEKDYVIVQGDKSTGKTYISKLLAKNNLYVLLDKDTPNTEERLFGDVYNSKESYNFLSKQIYLIIDDFEMLDEKLQIRIIGAIKYRYYNKNNDRTQLPVKAKVIINYNTITKVIKRFGLDNIVVLPKVNSYSPLNKMSIVYNSISPNGKIGIEKQALDYIDRYDYSYHGLKTLENLGSHIKEVIKDGDTIKAEHLPYWVTNKNYCNELGSFELRKIVDENIFDLKDAEYLIVKGAFKKTLFKKEETAKLLGVTVTTLNKKLRLYGLKAQDLMEE